MRDGRLGETVRDRDVELERGREVPRLGRKDRSAGTTTARRPAASTSRATLAS